MSTEPDRNMADGDWEEVTGDNLKNFPFGEDNAGTYISSCRSRTIRKKHLVDEYGRDSDDRYVELQEE